MSNQELILPDEYPVLLEQLKKEVNSARQRAVRSVNTELITLYWKIGKTILDRQGVEGWGAKVIDRLAADLREAFPEMKGFSRSNLEYMRRFADGWQAVEFPQQFVGELPWGHIMLLLDKTPDHSTRDWYATQAMQSGWSRAVLQAKITGKAHLRIGAAPSNFPESLPPEDSELAQQLTADPVIFDFLDANGEFSEREFETNLVRQVDHLLNAFGVGFAYVGRQWHLEVDGRDFFIDILLFNYLQNRFIVVELKLGEFDPSYVGQLSFYVAVIDDKLRKKEHASTVGILICGSKSDLIVKYALSGLQSPMAVSRYSFETDGSAMSYEELPSEEQQVLPSAESLIKAVDPLLEDVLHGLREDH